MDTEANLRPSGSVLIVEDDNVLAEAVTAALQVEGFTVERVTDGAQGLQRLSQDRFSVVVLDLMMPNLDGHMLVTRLRSNGDRTPILMMSAQHAVEERIKCLDAGADDYLLKPFRLAELSARVRALQRRSEQSHQTVVGPLAIEWDKRSLAWNGTSVQLTNREFALMALLVRNRGRIVSRKEIVSDLFGEIDLLGSDNLVEVNITRLRRKMQAAGCPDLIRTIRGIGYRLAEGII